MAEPGTNVEEMWRIKIGESGTPIRRIKDKAVRADLERSLRERPDVWPPEMRLRACLALGRAPEPGLLSALILRRALSVIDCISFTNQLSGRHLLINAEAVLSTLAALLGTDRKARVERIAGALGRTVTKWHNQKNPVALDSRSIRAYIDVLIALFEKAKESRSRVGARRDTLLLNLVAFALVAGAQASDIAVHWQILRLLQVAQSVIEPELSGALEQRADLRSAYDSVVKQVIENVRTMALTGKKDELEDLTGNLLRWKFTEQPARHLLESLYSDRGALEIGVQRVLANLLGIEREMRPEPDFEASASPSVQSIQLASALIRSWAAAGDSPHAQEAFDELHSVLQNFFGIRLKGERGEIGEFNPVVHELLQTPSDKPKRVPVIRPRVEKSDGSVTTVLIKAPVEPV